ncbi:phosphoribosylanthranilate isomerase [Raphidocelis subcapitata]|uniref:phosphoribosylanthranilate isomerase n=1 Tax=Raphidocelis subcapitata TaxID=307507 RepID=A0A2V0P3G6_9CHLO|nr:phosphoribosylanthranilate isomerase [Raphidocelis subcapitata]|eukprot:GBF94406.1 phosphoribosylanthranilate isomerase [Raphidocelis subcapitata]
MASHCGCGGAKTLSNHGAVQRAALRPAARPPRTRLACSASGGASSSTSSGTAGAGSYRPLVKVCGVTNAADAEVAARAGANFIGMIMWPKAKRAVSDETASAIAATAARHGALAVGVFVDEDAATIAARCGRAGIPVAQLHGDGARAALGGLPERLQVVYVLHADQSGQILTGLPDCGRAPEWLLVDGQQGGSGQAYDWSNLRPPAGAARGWLLAGGLHPGNVADAVAATRPGGVDVSSGVCGPDGLRKDAGKVEAFVAAALGAAPADGGAR